MGVFFNHKNEYQRGWCYCALTAIFSLILIVSSLFSDTNVEESIKQTTLHMVEFIAGCTLSIVTVILVTESFVVLLRNLYKRFEALNSLLRLAFLNVYYKLSFFKN